jgi:hypothetical protein
MRAAADDSGSMAFEDGGERVEDLKMIGSKVRASHSCGRGLASS